MVVVQRARVKSPLPNVTSGSMRSIPRCGVPSVRLLQSLGQRVDLLRNDRQMHVIGHQTVAQGLQLMWLDLFPHRSSKNQTLAIGSENELPSISVLRDVMPNIER